MLCESVDTASGGVALCGIKGNGLYGRTRVADRLAEFALGSELVEVLGHSRNGYVDHFPGSGMIVTEKPNRGPVSVRRRMDPSRSLPK